MIPRIWLINAVLGAALVFLGTESYSVWSGKGFDVPVAGADTKEEKADLPGRITPSRIQNRSEYELVATANLFSPERSEFIPEEADPEQLEKEDPEAKPLKEVKDLKELKEKIFLQGVIIMNGFKTALVSNPYRKTKDDPKNLTVKEGDLVGDLKVVSILPDRIGLEKGTDRYEIKLYDEKKPPREIVKAKGKGKDAEPQVVSVSTENAGAQSDSGKSQPSKVQGSVSEEHSAVEKSNASGTPEPEDEYINTPFGKIKRIKKK